MRILDDAGQEVQDFDPTQGRVEQRVRQIEHPAVEGVQEQGHWETVAEYPETGGKEISWVVDVPGVEARAAYTEEETYHHYIPYTPEEKAAREAAWAAEQAARPPTEMETLIEIAGDLTYRLCLMELGVNASDLSAM